MTTTRAGHAAQQQLEFRHIIDHVLDDVEEAEEYLASLNCTKMPQFLRKTRQMLKGATRKAQDGTDIPIDDVTFTYLWGLQKFIAFKDNLPDPDTRIQGQYLTIQRNEFISFINAVIDPETEDVIDEKLDYLKSVAESDYNKKQRIANPTAFGNNPAATSNFIARKSPADEFRKGVKRDVTQFPKLEDLAVYFKWYNSFVKVARAQGVDQVLDPHYSPTPGTPEEDLFQEQLKYMDNVIDHAFQCAEAKQLLTNQRTHGTSSQHALKELSEVATKSSAAQARMTKTLAEVEASHWEPTFRGGARGYVSSINDKLVEHNEIAHTAALKLSDQAMKVRLRRAVQGLPVLANIATLEDITVSRDPSAATSYQQYLNLLLSAADRYDVESKAKNAPAKPAQKLVFMGDTTIGSSDPDSTDDLEMFHEFLTFKAARTNASGQVRMDSQSWRSLPAADKEIWDTMSEESKAIILKAADSSAPSKRQPRRPPNQRQAQAHSVDPHLVAEVIAHMHSMQIGGPSDDDDTGDATHADAPNDYKAYATKVIDKLPPSDPRRMMSKSLASKAPAQVNSGDGNKRNVSSNMTQVSISVPPPEDRRQVEVSACSWDGPGAMFDRGSNCNVAGDDCRTIYKYPNQFADLTAATQHQQTGMEMGKVGFTGESSIGPVICLLPQSVLSGKGPTIISAVQAEAHGIRIDDRPKAHGGTQTARTPDGVLIPIDFRNGLAYTRARPFTDEEYNTLPHIHLGADHWEPHSTDCIISTEERWYDAIDIPGFDPNSSLFTIDGDYKHRHAHFTQIDGEEFSTQIDGDAFYDCFDAPPVALLDDMHSIADDCAEIYTRNAHFMDSFSYFSDSECDTSTHEYSVYPAITRSQTRNKPALGANPPDPMHGSATQEPPGPRPAAREPRRITKKPPDFAALRPFLGWLPVETIKRTFAVTTQHARLSASTLLKKHFRSPFPALNVRRRSEDVATDFVYSDTPAVETGHTIAAIFVGRTTKVTDAYGISTEKDFPATLEDNVRERGAMDRLISDRAKALLSRRTVDFLRYFCIQDWQSEPYHQNQNFAENRIDDIKRLTNTLMDRTGTPAKCWLLCLTFVCFLLNNVAHPSLNWNTPLFTLTGQRNDISMLLCFVWYQPVYYKVYDTTFPSDSTEGRGRFVGISEHVGHSMTFKILTDDTQQIIYRSELRSALDHQHTNLRLDTIFDGEVAQEFIKGINKAAQDTVVQELMAQNGESSGTKETGECDNPSDEPAHSKEDGEDENSSDIKDSSKPQFVPADLIGRTFLMDKRKDGQRHRAKIIDIVEAVEKHQIDFSKDKEAVKFKVSIDNDKYEDILSFGEVVDYIEKRENNTSEPVWNFKRITAHQGPLRASDPNYLGSQWNVLIQSESGEINEMPLTLAAAEEPVICALYASEQGLLDTPGWKRFKTLASRQKKLLRQVNQAKLRSYRTAPKYMYGYEVPRNYEHAVQLDRQNGNRMWQEATELEMKSLHEYNTFKDFGHKDKGNKPPDDYKKIRVHLVFAVKHDGRHKARLVADGHLTDIPIESVYSGVVSLRGLRTVLFLAELNGLQSYTTDIGNAYLEAETKEKVYIVAGPEFGELEGHILVIRKALYGLRTSGKRWGERLNDCLRSMGFQPCKAEPDIWLRRKGDIYEYIATYVDDLEIASDDPMSIIDDLQNKHGFKLKGTGPISFHLGCDFVRDDDGTLCMEPKKYIDKMKQTYERIFGTPVLQKYHSPLDKGDHPELDESDFLDQEGIQIYQSLIGSLQWALSLARFDIATAVMTMSSFRVAPRVGHLERVKRMYGYLAKFPHAKLRFRTLEPDYSGLPDISYDWEYTVYGNVEEKIPDDIPTPLGKYVRITHYVDANLYHDKLTGRSVTGILDFLNQTPIDWFSKKQSTVETATYGSEFVASRTCVERDIDLRTLLRYLGVPIRKTAFMFGDNESVVNSSSTPHAKLHKRHSALSFHRVREAIASKIIKYHHTPSNSNPADILSKHWGHNQVWPLLNCVLFWKGDTIDLFKPDETDKDGEQNHVTSRQHGE